MPMNKYGEIIRNSSSPPPILPHNHNGNNGPEKKNAFYIILGSLVLVVIVVLLAKNVRIKDHSSANDYGEVVAQNTEKTYEPSMLDYSNNEGKAFYGIWIYASKELNLAQEFAKKFDTDGYKSIVFLTSEWKNLNQDAWYAVSLGIYNSKEDAESTLPIVQKKYSDAYIKYSGNYQK